MGNELVEGRGEVVQSITYQPTQASMQWQGGTFPIEISAFLSSK